LLILALWFRDIASCFCTYVPFPSPLGPAHRALESNEGDELEACLVPARLQGIEEVVVIPGRKADESTRCGGVFEDTALPDPISGGLGLTAEFGVNPIRHTELFLHHSVQG
jgi:hypothetical protein